MDLATRLTELQKRTTEHREVLLTEEAAKTALVMPFIQALGSVAVCKLLEFAALMLLVAASFLGPFGRILGRFSGALRLDRRTRQVSVAGRTLKLMPRSMQLLERLIRDPGEVVRREELERLLWPEGDAPADALRGQVYLLRRALSEAGYDDLETVHGVGFRLRA